MAAYQVGKHENSKSFQLATVVYPLREGIQKKSVGRQIHGLIDHPVPGQTSQDWQTSELVQANFKAIVLLAGFGKTNVELDCFFGRMGGVDHESSQVGFFRTQQIDVRTVFWNRQPNGILIESANFLELVF